MLLCTCKQRKKQQVSFVLMAFCRAFSWTTFHDESSCHLLSPGPASASLQRSTYSAFMPTSPHINRLSVIKQESLDQSQDVFVEYLIPKMEIKEEPECDGDNSSNSSTGPGRYQMGPTVNYPPAQSPAFPTPVTPSPRSPMNFPPASKFFPQHFQPKTNLPPYSVWSASTLLSPAPSLHSSSQEELMQCRPWKYEVKKLVVMKFNKGKIRQYGNRSLIWKTHLAEQKKYFKVR